MEGQNVKISLVEYLIVMPIVIGIDLVDFGANWLIGLPVAGQMLGTLVYLLKIAAMIAITIYFMLRGVSLKYFWPGAAPEIAPLFGGIIPGLSLGTLVSLVMKGRGQLTAAADILTPTPFGKAKALKTIAGFKAAGKIR